MAQHCASHAARSLDLPRHHCTHCNLCCPTLVLVHLLAWQRASTAQSPGCPRHSQHPHSDTLPTVPPLPSLVTDAIRFITVHRRSCKPFGYTRPPVLVTLTLLNPSPTSIGLWSLRYCARCLPLLSVSLCQTRAAATPRGPQGGAQTGRSRGGGGGLEGSGAFQLRNQMMRSGEPPRMGPPLEAWQTRDRRPVGQFPNAKE